MSTDIQCSACHKHFAPAEVSVKFVKEAQGNVYICHPCAFSTDILPMGEGIPTAELTVRDHCK